MSLKVQINLTRDSVCMGDDVEDHTKIINISPSRNTTITVMDIAKNYLASVAGRGHTWDCILNGVTCAVISGNCTKIIETAEIPFLETNNLHFKYHSAKY